MKIAILSKADAAGGGGGRIAQDLTAGFNELGHETVQWVSWSNSGYNAHRRRLYGERWQRRFYRYNQTISNWLAPNIIPFEWPNLYLQNLSANFDIVHIHDISTAMSSRTLAWLATELPLLWTLHDCSALTGGCIHPMDCRGYLDGCGTCPQLGRWPLQSRHDLTHHSWKINRRVLQNPLIKLATPSKWLQRFAASCNASPHQPLLLKNGIDCQIFQPYSKDYSLIEALHLPPDAPVILLSSSSLDNPYKGIQDAAKALKTLNDQGLTFSILIVGQMDEAVYRLFQGLPIHCTGYIGNQTELVKYYNLADLLLFPSHADNQPLQILEAMATGLPVLAYATGGIPELLGDNTRGWLVPSRDVSRLTAAIASVLKGTAQKPKPLEIREWVLRNHNLNSMLNDHLITYQRVIDDWNKTRETSIGNRK